MSLRQLSSLKCGSTLWIKERLKHMCVHESTFFFFLQESFRWNVQVNSMRVLQINTCWIAVIVVEMSCLTRLLSSCQIFHKANRWVLEFINQTLKDSLTAQPSSAVRLSWAKACDASLDCTYNTVSLFYIKFINCSSTCATDANLPMCVNGSTSFIFVEKTCT